MKRLYLLRHAKAVAVEPGQDDHGRALTVRGMHDAGAMARYLLKNDFTPELMLISTSARTRQTADLVLREITARPDYREALYLAIVYLSPRLILPRTPMPMPMLESLWAFNMQATLPARSQPTAA